MGAACTRKRWTWLASAATRNFLDATFASSLSSLTVVAALSAGVATGYLSVIRYRSLSRPDGRREPPHTR